MSTQAEMADTNDFERWRGKIETLLEGHIEAHKRFETKLLGEDGDPDSGLIANLIGRLVKLETDRVRLGVVLLIAMGIFHLLGEHILERVFSSIFAK